MPKIKRGRATVPCYRALTWQTDAPRPLQWQRASCCLLPTVVLPLQPAVLPTNWQEWANSAPLVPIET